MTDSKFYDPIEYWESAHRVVALPPAYVAGLLDGEGCFCIYVRKDKDRTCYRCEVSVGMTTPEPLIALQARYGGHIAHQSRQREGWARRYTWKLGDPAQIDLLLRDVAPHAIVKRAQMGVALKFCVLRRSKSRTAKVDPEMTSAFESLRIEMQSLNQRGVDYAISA